MNTVTTKEIRAWGVENGYRCHVGKLGQKVIAAYTAEHPDAVIVDLPAPVEQTPIDEPEFFSATLEVPGAAADEVAELERLVLDVLMAAFSAGRAAERRDILTQLGIDA